VILVERREEKRAEAEMAGEHERGVHREEGPSSVERAKRTSICIPSTMLSPCFNSLKGFLASWRKEATARGKRRWRELIHLDFSAPNPSAAEDSLAFFGPQEHTLSSFSSVG